MSVVSVKEVLEAKDSESSQGRISTIVEVAFVAEADGNGSGIALTDNVHLQKDIHSKPAWRISVGTIEEEKRISKVLVDLQKL